MNGDTPSISRNEAQPNTNENLFGFVIGQLVNGSWPN